MSVIQRDTSSLKTQHGLTTKFYLCFTFAHVNEKKTMSFFFILDTPPKSSNLKIISPTVSAYLRQFNIIISRRPCVSGRRTGDQLSLFSLPPPPVPLLDTAFSRSSLRHARALALYINRYDIYFMFIYLLISKCLGLPESFS